MPNSTDDHADHGPDRLAGHERTVQRTGALRDPDAADGDEDHSEDPPQQHHPARPGSGRHYRS